MPDHHSDGVIPFKRPHVRLGQVLVDNSVLAPQVLSLALARQRETGARLGEVLTANGWSGPEEIAAALAWQNGFAYFSDPGDMAHRLTGKIGFAQIVRHRALPVAEVDGRLTLATPDPDRAADLAKRLDADLAVISDATYQRAICRLYGHEISAVASTLTPADQSVRSLTAIRLALIAVLALSIASLFWATKTTLLILTMLVALVAAATSVTRLAALASGRPTKATEAPPDTVALADHRRLPVVSLLIPLFRETRVIGQLIDGLQKLDYPRDRLDVKLLLEAGDHETAAAAAEIELPPWIDVLTVPPGQPRTKPRALNAALDFCRGEIIGILDAEDRPEPAQLRTVTRHLAQTSHKVAAVQCQLAFFNARENWITRCFQIEYSIWFDVLLRGWQRLGLPLPLGGTSVYFRRQALIELGGWDAHNVTEDADLGMRLARAGRTCDVVSSTTAEEANCRVGPWIRQRSRWLKGYLLTWLSHMRNPVRLWRELGAVGFLGFQILLLGGAISYLAIPLFWLALGLGLVTGQSLYGDLAPGWALMVLFAIFATGQVVMLAAATLALWRRHCLRLLPWVAVMPIYWSLGALAAWKALAEVAVAPYFWDKTAHGVTRFTPE